jgi:hypothetical protein
MDNEVSILVFFHSLGSMLRLLLRLVNVLLEYGLSGHTDKNCRLCWFRDGSDGAILLLRLLLTVEYIEKAGNDRCVVRFVWSFSPAWEAVKLTMMAWGAPRRRRGCHFH